MWYSQSGPESPTDRGREDSTRGFRIPTHIYRFTSTSVRDKSPRPGLGSNNGLIYEEGGGVASGSVS